MARGLNGWLASRVAGVALPIIVAVLASGCSPSYHVAHFLSGQKAAKARVIARAYVKDHNMRDFRLNDPANEGFFTPLNGFPDAYLVGIETEEKETLFVDNAYAYRWARLDDSVKVEWRERSGKIFSDDGSEIYTVAYKAKENLRIKPLNRGN